MGWDEMGWDAWDGTAWDGMEWVREFLQESGAN